MVDPFPGKSFSAESDLTGGNDGVYANQYTGCRGPPLGVCIHRLGRHGDLLDRKTGESGNDGTPRHGRNSHEPSGVGAPYELAGKRMVFANWYFIQPGDLDWRDDDGKSVYVSGNEGPFGAHFVGIRAAHGIRICAEKPEVVGPLERPHRMILQNQGLYKGWTDSDYYESTDGLKWERTAPLKLGKNTPDGFYQEFLDPAARPEERFKLVWGGSITRAQFEEFRARRPRDWEPRALFLLGEKDDIACLFGAVSPDGIQWTTLANPLLVEYNDSWNTVSGV